MSDISRLTKIVYLDREQYQILKSQGYYIINGVTKYYDPDTLYLVKRTGIEVDKAFTSIDSVEVLSDGIKVTYSDELNRPTSLTLPLKESEDLSFTAEEKRVLLSLSKTFKADYAALSLLAQTTSEDFEEFVLQYEKDLDEITQAIGELLSEIFLELEREIAKKQNVLEFDGEYNAETNKVVLQQTADALNETVKGLSENYTKLSENFDKHTQAADKNFETVNKSVKSNTDAITEANKALTSLDTRITNLESFDRIKIVKELPTTGDSGVIYLLKSKNETEGDVFEEWFWYTETVTADDGTEQTVSDWEKLGAVSLNIDDYYTKDKIDELFDEYEVVVDDISVVRNAKGELSLASRYKNYLDDRLYVSPSIETFTLVDSTSVGAHLVGTTVTIAGFTHSEAEINSLVGNLTFTIGSAYSKSIEPATSDTTIYIDTNANAADNQPYTIKNTSTASLTVRLAGKDIKDNAVTSSKTYNWYYPFYYGGSTKEDLTDAEIAGPTGTAVLTRAGLSNNYKGNRAITLENDAYIYFAAIGFSITNLKDAATNLGVGFTLVRNDKTDENGNRTINVNGVNLTMKLYRTTSVIKKGKYTLIIS
jgi:hypothetical protein